jgi:methionyl-tRNA formyltransferase
MKKMSEPIVFFGSGPVAAESLKLLAQDYEIESVVTKPKPAHHKGSFPVVELAEELGLNIVYTSNKQQLIDHVDKIQFTSRVALVIDYGIIIPQIVINKFEFGILNSHFSLLPKWRGADPISFAILNGDERTGVSLMSIVEALDEGPLLAQSEFKLSKDIDTRELTSKLIELSDELIDNNLSAYLEGKRIPYPQPDEGITYSHKLSKSDGNLDFSKPAKQLECQIRAYIEWPRSYTEINGVLVTITQAHASNEKGKPGDTFRNKYSFGFYTTEGSIIFDKLIPSGKKEMSAQAFMLGYNF